MLCEEGMQESVTAWRNSLRYLGYRVLFLSMPDLNDSLKDNMGKGQVLNIHI